MFELDCYYFGTTSVLSSSVWNILLGVISHIIAAFFP
jgi:uncharacterized membrane protein